jgi:hydroxyacylglutathione hydrolase
MPLTPYKIEAINAFKDNYIWVMIDLDNKTAAVVDPGDATPVLAFLKKHLLQLTTILITHHHHDHSGGVAELKRHYPDVSIYGKSRDNIATLTRLVCEHDEVAIGKLIFHVIEIPGHTLDHIAYYTPGILFCGDTLFSAGCGRVFEGTAAQMYTSLQKIAALPDDTAIYCGHEYTLNNLLFAQTVEPHNLDIKNKIGKVKTLRDNDLPTVPSLLSEEKTFNPFLRCDKIDVIYAAEKHSNKQLSDPISIFAAIREWKNNF